MKIIEKLLACGALAVAATVVPTAGMSADAYPSKPIKLVLPFAAGGQSDVVARIAAERLTSALGQPLVVENVGGAGGMIAASKVARSPADGYTLFLPNASTLTIAPHLQPGSGVTPSSFAPIATVSQFPLVLVVNSNSPYKSLADVIAAAKSKPGKLSFASPGVGTTPHLAGETFSQEAGITITTVPYKGGAPALNDLLAGQVDLYFEAPATIVPQIQAGKLRALAVTGKKRMAALPNVPTVAEQGFPKLTLESWAALVAPKGTPPAIIERLRTEIEKVVKSQDFTRKLEERGFEPLSTSPAELARMINEESVRWGQIIKERRITVN
ncbi:tripartite tricarboxylate transporter substrate binding protein (plasmid) [Cupriavidus sp. KK10]|uniref:Bug family tripartite tricarboxylate transporter substrate binding protein n=1 Tax=Cupriavidus sp. KK10 TaxID=1478019 RepID=UPI001BA8884C|nr:tripartite tricarboxylate transporter substrate binding protein [Cupriavidus sp. KK10]QUN31883.1 tripartite tricarboxylate transporter substrate binding protein [Cupriavidus sp. KK10]